MQVASGDKQILPEDSQTALAESEEMRGYTELQENELEYVDVICGGFPCQDISVAGRGEGIHGSRSGLWKEMFRIIRELRPRYVIVENVPALLGRGIDVVLGDLASCGYDAEWDCIPASAFGAPHQRNRVWIVAYARCIYEPFKRTEYKGIIAKISDRKTSEFGSSSKDVADTDSEGLQGTTQTGIRSVQKKIPESERRNISRRMSTQRGNWAVEPDVGRVAHGVSNRVDRLRTLGNAIVPQIAEWIGRRIIEAEDGH